MTMQTLTIGGQEFVLLAKHDFQRLAAQARRQTEDDYWTQADLKAEADARSKKQRPIAFEQVRARIGRARKWTGQRPPGTPMSGGRWQVELLPVARTAPKSIEVGKGSDRSFFGPILPLECEAKTL
jgi:hypothetical protein